MADKHVRHVGTSRYPATVEFGELECCALEKATREAEHHQFIKSFLASVEATKPRYPVSILTEIFSNTAYLAFVPRPVHQLFYSELVLRERELIKRHEEVRFDCGHTASEHLKALESIHVKMASPQGHN